MGPLGRVLPLYAPEKWRLLVAVLLGFATLASGVGLMGTSAWLIATAALHPSIATLQVAIVGVRLFGISRGFFRYLERLASHDLTFRALARLRRLVYAALEPLSPARLQSQRSGDLLARLVSDVETHEGLFVRAVGPSLVALLGLLLTVAILLGRGAAVATAGAGGLVLAGVAVPWLAWRLGREAGARIVTQRARLGAQLVDTVQGVAELLAFGREQAQLDALRRSGLDLAREQRAAAQAASLGSALVVLLGDLTCLGVLLVAVPAVRQGEVGGVQLAVVALVTLASFEIVAGLPAAAQGLAAMRVASARIFEILDQPPEVVRPDLVAQSGLPFALHVQHMRFRYPGSAVDALEDVSLRLSPGRFVAVVGPSGAGKSTLSSLLLRFWEVPPGMLFLGGRDVRELDPEAVRAHFGFVSQRVHLLSGTLRENLCLGRPAAAEAHLRAALHDAGLDTFVARLPDGLDTWIGEQGVRLSGGERQRLALARALLTDSQCLLLDEPTAHLDPDTELALLERMAAARAGRALLLITHRLVGLERADEILVLDRGRIVERGAAGQLLQRGGLFARMRALQRAEDVLEAP